MKTEEIKFRAWIENLDKEPKMVYGTFEELINSFKPSDFRHECYSCMKYTIMQYTGLKDKNNKEIYEGDIVTYDDANGWKWLITYSSRHMRFFGVTTNPLACVDFFPSPADLRKNPIEVVGNIYENPNSLKNETFDKIIKSYK